VHPAAQDLLQLAARGAAHGLDHAPVGADEDALLGLGLHPHQRAHSKEAITNLIDALDDDLDRVGHLLEGTAQHLLAHQLGQLDLDA
jgi:hypothetical protein